MIEFVFMLTRDDVTVPDALEVFGSLRESGLRYVGFKDIGPPARVLREVTAAAHDADMEVMLEVVSVTREDELRSLRVSMKTNSITGQLPGVRRRRAGRRRPRSPRCP